MIHRLNLHKKKGDIGT